VIGLAVTVGEGLEAVGSGLETLGVCLIIGLGIHGFFGSHR
jgi:hypothetical protein